MHKIQKFFLQLFIFLMFFSINTTLLAKRLSSPMVQPVVYQNIIYSAAYDRGGKIEARNKMTKKLLWTKQIYYIKYDDNLEKDIQDVFIKSLFLKKNNLLIIDERERHYLLNLKTHKLNNEIKYKKKICKSTLSST